jgi:hypothetical protein
MNDAAHGKTTYTAPANIYVGLSTTTPALGGTNVTEPSGNNYSRVTTPGSSFGASASGVITNTSAITFPTSSGSWGTCTYIVVYDASSAGNLLWYASIGSQSVPSGATPTIPIGAATSTLS